jgi:hypothetical protein
LSQADEEAFEATEYYNTLVDLYKIRKKELSESMKGLQILSLPAISVHD